MDRSNPDLSPQSSVPLEKQPPRATSEGGSSLRILLEEVPAPRTPPAGDPAPAPSDPAPLSPLKEAPPRPSRFAPLREFIGRGYFDPARAFAVDVDWERFRRAHIFLLLLSLAMPFLMLLFLGFLLGLVYLAGTAWYSVNAPNPIHEVMLYPFVFVLARGYWIAYLALPLGLYALAWLWAFATAGALSAGTEDAPIDFKKALSVLALMGAMLAPFTLFPFLRLLALAVIFGVLVKRMEDTFEIGFWRLAGRGGLILLGTAFLYGAFERKVESYFPAGEEMRTSLDAFVRQKKPLVWPAFHPKVFISPQERLFADLSDFNAQIRDDATTKALAILKSGTESPEFRYRLASRLAENGQSEAYPYAARYEASGQGTSVNLAAALGWAQKYAAVNPNNLEAGLEKARLLMLNGRRLEGKQWLVQLAKIKIKDLHRITSFIQKENLGQVDSMFTTEVQNLYMYENPSVYVGSYTSISPNSRYAYEYQTRQEALAKRLYASGYDQSLWFYRALVAEYARSAVAGAEVYGESSLDYQATDLDQKLKEGDPIALDIAADRSARDGDLATARTYWMAATRGLNNDDRRSNVQYYLKLAASYDPEESPKDANPHEATRYYLASLLISSWYGRSAPLGMKPLQRLNPGRIPDPAGQPFLDLCLKYDVPEAWVMMGYRHLNGDFAGVPKSLPKAKDCFLKARELGFKGPQFFKQLTILDPAKAS